MEPSYHESELDALCAQNASTQYDESAYNNETVYAVTPETASVDSAQNAQTDELPLPSFSGKVRGSLPDILQRIDDIRNSDADADILILGALTVISAALPHISGLYDKCEVFPNFFCFVAAPAGSGKGRLALCRYLVSPIDDQLLKESNEAKRDYRKKLNEYYAPPGCFPEKPEEPPMRMLILPANSSSTAVYQTLNDNNGRGLIFETEGDTLSANFNTDYGNFSDGFRKAFHHEPISYLRRKDREYVKIDRPKLSALLAGTPRQVANLIHDSENGLFSRFVFYYMISKLEWHDVFERVNDTGMEDYFKKLGREIKVLYEHLEASPRTLRFRLTDRQETDFNKTLSALLNQYAADYGSGIAPSVKRLGLVMFRIAMCLSALRLTEDGNFVDDIVCLDQDYETAMEILSVLIEHTVVIYEQLPANSSLHGKGKRTSNRLTNLFNALPDEFDKATFKAVAEKMNLNPRSMYRNLSKWRDAGLVQDVARGRYRKVKKA